MIVLGRAADCREDVRSAAGELLGEGQAEATAGADDERGARARSRDAFTAARVTSQGSRVQSREHREGTDVTEFDIQATLLG